MLLASQPLNGEPGLESNHRHRAPTHPIKPPIKVPARWPLTPKPLTFPQFAQNYMVRGGEPLQQVVTDELAVIGLNATHGAPFFLTFIQLDLPLIGAPRRQTLAPNVLLTPSLWICCGWKERPSKKYLFVPLIKQLALLELLKETTAGRVVWLLISLFGNGRRD